MKNKDKDQDKPSTIHFIDITMKKYLQKGIAEQYLY